MRNSNRRWRKAMWEAVNDAAGNGDCGVWVRDVHPIWGLRAIRDFERINNVKFDPFDTTHTRTTFWKGRALITLRYMEAQARNLAALSDALKDFDRRTTCGG